MVGEQTCVILGSLACYIFSGAFSRRWYKNNFFIAVFAFHDFFSEKVGRKEIELTRVHPISKMFQDLMAGIKPQALRRDVGRLSGSSFLCSEYATMFCN
jgi:hypothetical protein